ncbi:MAG TPA: redoxin family protein [Gemmataceae bacterium]
MYRFAVALVAGVLAFGGAAQAGKFNKVLSIGDKAPTYEGLAGTDDKQHSSKTDLTKDVAVICITCNHCPVAIAYEDRIIDFVKKYGDKIDFVAINVNNTPADRLDKMKERAKEKGFNFTYLYDPSQKIASSLGASVTPEFFVLKKDGDAYKVVYMGSLDDNQKRPTKSYLADAVDAALAGKTPAVQETRAFGCGVQYERR